MTLTLGQSGAALRTINLDGTVGVEKSGPVRLALQAEKQGNARPTAVRVPRILREWDGSSFVMEYVHGLALGTYLSNASSRETAATVGQLTAYVADNLSRSTEGLSEASRAALVAKVGSVLAANVGRLPVRLEHGARALLTGAVASIDPPVGVCHGDFSYENILVSPTDGQVWLIDFLDTVVETPVADIARLLIDSENGWWVHDANRTAGDLISARHLSDELRNLAPTLGLEISFFKVYNALRVLPYTRPPVRRSYLLETIANELDRKSL